MTDAVRMVVWLREAMDAVERDAEAAGGDEWRLQDHPSDVVAIYDSKGEPVVYDEGWPTEAQKAHIVRHGPAAVLRRIAADRKMLDDLLAERHEVVDGDCWYTCAAATEEHDGGETCDDDRLGKPCDCGRDARVERRVRLLAEGYGWAEDAT